MPSFLELGLLEPICRTLDELRFAVPTSIQQAVIPPLLEGKDVLAIAPVGAGKTAAYLLPMIHRLADPAVTANGREPRAIVLTAARDRAEAIGRALGLFASYVPVRHVAAADSGSWNKQSKELRTGVEVVVTTPRQLIQLIRAHALAMRALEIIVLDDVDLMLDQGMNQDLERIEQELPDNRQTAFFVEIDDETLRNYARTWLKDPLEIDAPLRQGKGASGAPDPVPIELPDWLDDEDSKKAKARVALPGWLDENAPAKPAAKTGKAKPQPKTPPKTPPKPKTPAKAPVAEEPPPDEPVPPDEDAILQDLDAAEAPPAKPATKPPTKAPAKPPARAPAKAPARTPARAPAKGKRAVKKKG